MDTTTIEIEVEEWERLNKRKKPGDSFNDVLKRVLDSIETYESSDTTTDAPEPRTPPDTAESGDIGHIEAGGGASSVSESRVRRALSALDVPGSGTVAEKRREAIFEMWRLLRDEGTATKANFLTVVDLDAVAYQSKDSFWSNCIKGKDTLRALPGVEPPSEGMSRWRYDPGAE